VPTTRMIATYSVDAWPRLRTTVIGRGARFSPLVRRR
jgi:hypothetical protein